MPPADRPESEALTRHRRIDPQLERAGWQIRPFVEGSPVPAGNVAVTEYPTANGPADYALFVDGRLLGIVEAKKITLGPAGVLTQAERYARGVAGSPFDFRGLRVPFLYSTNGELIHFHDVRHPLATSRRVSRFHAPAAVAELIGRDLQAACAWFDANPPVTTNCGPIRSRRTRPSRRHWPSASGG